MAGGIGSRFWPMSRTTFPKQFHDVLGIGKTLIQQTFDRYDGIVPPENILVVTNSLYKDLVKEQLPEIKESNILCEPSRRNTAPCIAYAAFKIIAENPEARMVVAPADHLIMKEAEFQRIIQKALTIATEADHLVTLGIRPTRPDTGYGYIQFDDEQLNGDAEVRKVKTFTEKPELPEAKRFLADGSFYWNSGIFIWTANTITTALKHYLPDVGNLFEEGMSQYNTEEEQAFVERVYPICPNESIDFGVMEGAGNDGRVRVVLSDFGWSDLGTWGSLYTHLTPDEHDNAIVGSNVSVYNSERNMVNAAGDHLVVLEGLSDYVVVVTDDVTLVCRRENEQEIKTIVQDLKFNKKDNFL